MPYMYKNAQSLTLFIRKLRN